MIKHTPGPWYYAGLAGDHDFGIYPESTGRDIALVRDFNEANARLIAAAPDMLAALENARNVLAGLACGDLTRIHRSSPTLEEVREAIRKATGE